MMRLLKFIWEIPIFLKKKYKERLFNQLADLGENVCIHSMANIRKDKESKIIIKGHNDLLCNIIALGESKN